MRISHRILAALCFPLAASALLTSCAGSGYYGDQPYDSGATVYIADSSRPRYYDNDAYFYGGRYYSGGRYETGNYRYNGHSYSNRYYHNGQYLYGGSRQSRPGNSPNQHRPGNPPSHVTQQRPPQSHGPAQGSKPSKRPGNPGNSSQRPPGGHGNQYPARGF